MRLTARRTAGGLLGAIFIAVLAAAVTTTNIARAAEPIPSSNFIKNIPASQRAVLATLRGKSLPPHLLDDLTWVNGSPISIGSTRGKVVLIQLWSFDKPSDRAWWKQVARSQQRFGDDDLTVLAIHTHRRVDQAKAYIEREKELVPLVTAVDTTGAVTRFFHAEEGPINIVIDRQGAIRTGGLNGRGVDVMLKKLIAEPFDPDAPAPAAYDDKSNDEHAASPTPTDAPPEAKTPTPEKTVDFPPFANPVTAALDLRGKKAPAVEVAQWLTDKADTRGKVVVVDFWATWCGPCIASIPHMNELADRFRDDVVVIGISKEKPGVVRKFLTKKEMRYHVGVDTQGRTQNAVKVRGIPHVIIISPDGIVRFQGHPAYLKAAILDQIVRASRSLPS